MREDAMTADTITSREPVTYVLERSIEVPAPIERVYSFFDRPENLGEMTPPWIGFRMLTPDPVPMDVGSVIDYAVRVHGVPMRWTTLIAEYDPPYRFVDVQLKGPYGFWHHTHTFKDTLNGTLIRDRVCYLPPFGALGRMLHAAFIRRDIESIFAYRRDFLRQHFGIVTERANTA